MKFISSTRKILEIKGDFINGIDFNYYNYIKGTEPLYSFLKYYSNNIVKLTY